jgi:hypothetical protein
MWPTASQPTMRCAAWKRLLDVTPEVVAYLAFAEMAKRFFYACLAVIHLDPARPLA